METELEKLEKQRKDLFNELDLLREFETESMMNRRLRNRLFL